jgi:V-type H+-transporting ATPase subunit a
MDSVWKITPNQMAFTNSFKMKLSVIIGVIHMSLGIVLKGINSIRKKNYLDLFTLVIPQLLFMGSTFIYMDILIVIKWLTKYKNTANAPSIINTLIGMFISNTHKS